MPILGQNAITKSIFLLIWVPPPLLNNVKQLQLWRRSTSLIHITIAISTIIGIIGTSLHLGKCWFSNIKKRNQLQKLNVSRANLLNSWKNTFFYGRQSYTLLFNFGKYKTIAAATELPTCKTNCPAVRRTLHTARPLRRAGATFPLGAVGGKQRHDVLGEQCSQQPRRQHQRQQALPCQHRQPLLARRQQVNDLREILEAGVSSGVTSDLASLLEWPETEWRPEYCFASSSNYCW